MNKSLKLFMHLARLNSIVARRFAVLGLGLGEFMILYFLNESPDGKLRRVDIAEMLGLTASGITRMLLPMEKIGMVKRASDKNDGRVSYVVLAPGGKRLLMESMERAGLVSDDILASVPEQKLSEIAALIK